MAAPPSLRQLGAQDGRTALRESQYRDNDADHTTAQFLTAPVGPSGLVGFWIVRPRDADGPLPAVLYLHGGRWMFGDLDTHRHLISELAWHSRVAMVVPEYSLAPECRHPVALEECYSLLIWMHRHADDLGLDPRRLAVGGDCGGATLAIAVGMLAKARGGPRLRAQLLYYPPTDARCTSQSHKTFGSGYLLSSEDQAWYWEQYCDGAYDSPLVSPLCASAEDLAGLPPAMLITAEADVVRDEGSAFAANLRAAGVPVAATRYLGTVHDFAVLSLLRDLPSSRAARRQGQHFLREALHA